MAAGGLLAEASEQDRMLQAYAEQEQLGNIVLLSSKNIKAGNNDSIAVPEEVLDRGMYEPSRIMRSIQYLFDNNVIRIWRDSVLDADVKPAKHVDRGMLKGMGAENVFPPSPGAQ